MKKSVITTLLLLLASVVTIKADTAPRYIFYIIGDGMGHGHLQTARRWATCNLNDTAPLNLELFTNAAIVTTRSASSPVTDSAAAGTALATGTKTDNGMLGVTPDTIPVASVATQLQQMGYGVAIVTSVAADDATPGAFYAHVPSRSHYDSIAAHGARSGFNFIAGSQLRAKPSLNADSLFRAHGYAVARGLSQLPRATRDGARRILLLDSLNSKKLPFAIEAKPGDPTLARFSRAAIEHLDTVSPDRYFIMIEGGAVDWAAHSNDAATVALETLDLDGVVGQALQVYRQHPDETLIIVTADHETGGLTVGNNATQYNNYPKMMSGQRTSKNTFADIIGAMFKSRRNYTWDEIRQLLTDHLGLWTVCPVTPEEEAALQTAYNDIFVKRQRHERETLYGRHDDLTYTAFTILDAHAGNGWTSNAHTGNPVPLLAIGAGAHLFGGILDNTEIPRLILRAVRP